MQPSHIHWKNELKKLEGKKDKKSIAAANEIMKLLGTTKNLKSEKASIATDEQEEPHQD